MMLSECNKGDILVIFEILSYSLVQLPRTCTIGVSAVLQNSVYVSYIACT
jgi:hypothetical protein